MFYDKTDLDRHIDKSVGVFISRKKLCKSWIVLKDNYTASFIIFLPFSQYLTISYGLNIMMEQWESKYFLINGCFGSLARFYHSYRAAGGCDNLIWWQCWYLGWCWPQCCWQSWQRARCHCLLTVDGIIQVLTIPTLLTLHHHHHHPPSSPASKIIHSQHLAIWPDVRPAGYPGTDIASYTFAFSIHIFIYS